MKLHTLPVKRRPAPKGLFKRLRAVTGNRKQRVAATATADMEADDNSSKISRALTIIFLFHIVAIGLIFVHQKYLDDRAPAESKAAEPAENASSAVAVATPPRAVDRPRLQSGDAVYPVSRGDNYARIAAAQGVDEGDLRLVNQHAEIIPGLLLKIPPKRVVAVEPAEVTALRHPAPAGADDGLVDALPLDGVPRAQLVGPNSVGAEAAVASGDTYVVQSGDSIWRIANKYGVNQDALMKINGITDARKMRTGMSLVIPR
ncbi:MAG: LysM domain-containing protein [Akkermansiaceae bacterium]